MNNNNNDNSNGHWTILHVLTRVTAIVASWTEREREFMHDWSKTIKSNCFCMLYDQLDTQCETDNISNGIKLIKDGVHSLIIV